MLVTLNANFSMTKNVNIYIPEGKSVYYANFRAKEKDPSSGAIRSRQINRSTGSPSRQTAQSIANGMRDAALKGLFELVPKLRDDCPTVGDIIERFRRCAKIATVDESVRMFERVVAIGAGLDESELPRVHAVRLNQLTADSMQRFRDKEKSGRAEVTVNGMMRKARSLFSRRAKEYYRDLKLPDLKEWLGLSQLKEKDKHSRRFRQIPQSVLEAMDKGTPVMLRLARRCRGAKRNRWLNAWGTYWMMRRGGLRNRETWHVRWEWFVDVAGAGDLRLGIVNRDYYKPKGRSGFVPIARDLYDMLKRELGPVRPESFVLAGSKTDRREGAERQVNQYVSRYLRATGHTAYDLRGQWGSEMAAKYGIETASMLLRHSDIKTTWDYYYDNLKLWRPCGDGRFDGSRHWQPCLF